MSQISQTEWKGKKKDKMRGNFFLSTKVTGQRLQMIKRCLTRLKHQKKNHKSFWKITRLISNKFDNWDYYYWLPTKHFDYLGTMNEN